MIHALHELIYMSHDISIDIIDSVVYNIYDMSTRIYNLQNSNSSNIQTLNLNRNDYGEFITTRRLLGECLVVSAMF